MPADPRQRHARPPSPAAEHLHNLVLAGLGAAVVLQRRARALFVALVEEGRAARARRHRGR
ncbi:glyoxalase family protein [Mizugakiibacter sediminis]|uniref:Glyoxalase family protein n=1 Tax=Mizugakiibacter sediminis TaxID=1475481 RepID=A0A0K8QQ47_9GAMM|nr:hypothetical protein [Mizugakiibacter sediminis]GAP67030.1 glyoxalase family protein [Mizugakiibacter sediminis]